MKFFLFLLAWVEGSESAGNDKTGVIKQSDLMTQYLRGNKHIFAVEIAVPGSFLISSKDAKEIAYRFGCTEAFRANYTAHDSVSICQAIHNNLQHPRKITTIRAFQ